MTASQEQSKNIIDQMKQKLIIQVKEKQEELDKLQEEKEAVERARDEAEQSV